MSIGSVAVIACHSALSGLVLFGVSKRLSRKISLVLLLQSTLTFIFFLSWKNTCLLGRIESDSRQWPLRCYSHPNLTRLKDIIFTNLLDCHLRQGHAGILYHCLAQQPNTNYPKVNKKTQFHHRFWYWEKSRLDFCNLSIQVLFKLIIVYKNSRYLDKSSHWPDYLLPTAWKKL